MYNKTYIVKCALGFQLTKDNDDTQDDSFARLMVLHVFGLDIRDVAEVLQQQNEICFTDTRINKSLIITLLRIGQENTNENDQHITTTAEWTIDCDMAAIYALQTFNLALVDLKRYFFYEEDLLEVIENDINENERFILLASLSNTIDDPTFSNEKVWKHAERTEGAIDALKKSHDDADRWEFSNSIDDNNKKFNEKLHKIQQNYINITCQFLHEHCDFSIGRRMFDKLVLLFIDLRKLCSTLANVNLCEMVEDEDRSDSSQTTTTTTTTTTTYNPNQQSAELLPISALSEFNSIMINGTSHLNEL
ncbi:unnamed protein product [Rotaria sp. Silwood2]|nr:unnamed protein product [Rotaria sp. Silwood2]CAF3178902.1 unnamed protein product [Rotaria sp. Silwood2]CAF4186604.1 unnamed protein product [Rotaria sp. Silwood2]